MNASGDKLMLKNFEENLATGLNNRDMKGKSHPFQSIHFWRMNRILS